MLGIWYVKWIEVHSTQRRDMVYVHSSCACDGSLGGKTLALGVTHVAPTGVCFLVVFDALPSVYVSCIPFLIN